MPNKICQKCIASLSCFSALKKTFLDNQKTLLNSISDSLRDKTPSNPLNIELSYSNPTSIKSEPGRICETEFIEPEIIFYSASEDHQPENTKNLRIADCRLCKKSFANVSFLASHAKRVHQIDNFEYKPFKRFSCCIGFESRAGFKSHYDENHRSKITNHTCDFCGFQTTNKHVLSGHVKSHIIGDRRNRTPAACDQCDAILVSAYQLQVHKKNVHEHSESFKCFCGKTYKWQRSLDYHKKYVHENATKDHECPVCHHKFNLKSSLVKHMTNLHPENGKRPVHICETCGRSFSYLVALRRHRSVHLEKSFACEHCDKKFSRKENYLNHQAHHQTLPFPCQHCTRSFRINFELQKHLRRVHFKHQVKVKCELCSMWLASKETYRAHVLNKHRDVDSMIVNNLLDKIERTVPAKAPLKFLS